MFVSESLRVYDIFLLKILQKISEVFYDVVLVLALLQLFWFDIPGYVLDDELFWVFCLWTYFREVWLILYLGLLRLHSRLVLWGQLFRPFTALVECHWLSTSSTLFWWLDQSDVKLLLRRVFLNDNELLCEGWRCLMWWMRQSLFAYSALGRRLGIRSDLQFELAGNFREWLWTCWVLLYFLNCRWRCYRHF